MRTAAKTGSPRLVVNPGTCFSRNLYKLSVSTPIAVTGPFSDFSVGVAPGGFLTTMFRWYYGLIYVPWKWLSGERFPPDGIATCYKAMDWELPENALEQ